MLAIEEWEHLEFDIALSAFRAGEAFGEQEGTYSFGAAFVVRVPF